MGREAQVKTIRRQTRKAIGDDAAFFSFLTYDVMWVRGFWGRLKWLVFGR